MSWYRLEAGWAAAASWVPRSARQLPEHLLADEHHQPLDGQKVYIATTVARAAGSGTGRGGGDRRPESRLEGFSEEAPDVTPRYVPETVSTDG